MPEMSSSLPENGYTPSEEFKTRKSLKSAVIPDDDPLKIKLKISKADIAELGKNKKELLEEEKLGKSPRSILTGKTEMKNGDEKLEGESDERPPRTNIGGDPKMKLRSKKETEEEGEQQMEEAAKEKRKRKESSNYKDEGKPWKKRPKTMRYCVEEGAEKREEGLRRRCRRNDSDTTAADKTKEVLEEAVEVNKESFCWTCHKPGSVVRCDTCPRVFHLKCVSLSKDPSKDWICPECSLVLHAEKMSTRSEAMKSLSLDQLCTLLNFAIGRMKNVPESQAFWKPVDPKEVPNYDKYITNPMDLNLLERNMKAKMYGSPQAFLADAKWLLHNSIIFNSTQSPLTSTARFLVKICRQEMAEIENCPDCYLNAHTKEDWFIEVCRKPHILIWARLKGFPFWPAKAMSTNLKTQQVDARFFGAHDKAWVPVKECYLYSKNNPQILSKRRADLDEAFLEAEGYIKKIRQKYGSFCYAPDKTPFMPETYDKQLQSMIPNYKEEKPVKKKRKSEQNIEENGIVDKPCQNGKKLEGEQGPPHKWKLKRPVFEDSTKVDGDMCVPVNDYVSEEKVTNDERISPEDEIARSLEMFDTHKKEEEEVSEENFTDLDEDVSVPIPEHGYSRVREGSDIVQSSSNSNQEECQSLEETEKTAEETPSVEMVKENKKEEAVSSESEKESVQKKIENECLAESSSEFEIKEKTKESTSAKANNEQCEVSSTSVDLKVSEEITEQVDPEPSEASEHVEPSEPVKPSEPVEPLEPVEPSESVEPVEPLESLEPLEPLKPVEPSKPVESVEPLEPSEPSESSEENNKMLSKNQPTSTQDSEKAKIDSGKKEEEKSPKSFGNLTCDQKQKILTEAKLLANIDEMTAQGKEKVLNELGLDASQVDIRQLAQENRQILETLNKKCHNDRTFEEVSIKNEDFEQYLIEENNEDNIFDDDLPSLSPTFGSIKVRDFESLSNTRNHLSRPGKVCTEPMLKIMDVQSLKQSIKDSKMKRKKSVEEQSKKLQLEPVIKLVKLDSYDKSVENLNRKLRLSDEVSLLMVDGEKKVNVDVECVKSENQKQFKKSSKPPRARKSMPNKAKCVGEASKSTSKNINVISVDTENSSAQKSLLKSLCLEEKKSEDSGRKTLIITTNEKGIKNVDVKSSCEPSVKKQIKEVTIEAVKDTGKDAGKEGNLPQQKNLVMTNSHLIVTNNGPTLVTNQNNQPNLALTQNNLGQLSLVHLSNLTSGIQTNFINLTNETIGFNNSIGTLYASPGFNAEFPNSNSGVILTPSLTSSAASSPTSSKGGKAGNDASKIPSNRVGSGKSGSGISVKSPASLGLVSPSQPGKLPSMVAIQGDGIPLVGEVGSVTAELNKHSVKMAEYMRATIEDLLRELSNQGSLEAKYKLLTIEMEKMQWRHQQEIMELKHHSERSLMELRNSLESEKQKCLGELKAQLESQHQKIISETKRKQWCANCGKEALFYCCWNTSYCDYPCQQQHWPGHMSTCAQLGNNVAIGNTAGSTLPGKNPGMKYQSSNYVPIMSRGGNGSGSGGSHSGGPFAANRAIPTVQAQSSQARRSSDPSAPQLPINITIRPQHYFM